MSSVSSFSLVIRLSSGVRFNVSLPETPSSTSVRTLKQAIDTARDDCPTERQRLVFKGKILADERVLSDYGIVPDATLHLVVARGGTAPSPAPQPTTAPAPAATAPPPPPPANPFASPFGMPPNAGMPNLSPEQMSSMMNSPMMQSMMDNPDMLRTMLEANPQMRQLMDSNPQVREMINNPELLRQSMQMMRNPEAMQQAMRSQDLALSQLENTPGGFNALRNMYRDVQEPMMDAMSGGGNNNSNNTTTTSSSSGGTANNNSGATGAAMPNPWGSPSGSSPAASASSGSNPSAANPMMNPWAAAGAGGANPFGAAAAGANPFGAAAGAGGMPPPNMDQTLQMLENPMVRQMMDRMMENPAMMRQMIESNPMLQQTNPQLAQSLLENPAMMRQMMDPDNLRAMMQLQRSFGGAMPGMPGMAPPAAPAGEGAGLDFSNLLNQFQSTNLGAGMPPFPFGGAGAGAGAPQQQQQQHPADRDRVQIRSLQDMGFDDEQANLRALVSNHGNLNRAVDALIAGTVPAHVDGVSNVPPPSSTATNESSTQNDSTNQGEEQQQQEQQEPKGATEKKND